MGDLLLAVMMLAVFALGYYVTDRLGSFMQQNYRGYRAQRAPARKVYITETEEKNAAEVLKEICSRLDFLPDSDDYKIVLCRTVDPCILEQLEDSGCTIRCDRRE